MCGLGVLWRNTYALLSSGITNKKPGLWARFFIDNAGSYAKILMGSSRRAFSV